MITTAKHALVPRTLLALALFAPLLASAQAYRCQDAASGRTLYTDQPCKGGATVVPKPTDEQLRQDAERAQQARERAVQQREDAVLPYPDGVPAGYRLLQEYFVFPQKFGFVDLVGLEKLAGAQVKSRFTVRIVFDTEPSQAMRVSKGDIRLFCTPVANLFAHVSEPVTLDGTKSSWPVRPQGRDQGGRLFGGRFHGFHGNA